MVVFFLSWDILLKFNFIYPFASPLTDDGIKERSGKISKEGSIMRETIQSPLLKGY